MRTNNNKREGTPVANTALVFLTFQSKEDCVQLPILVLVLVINLFNLTFKDVIGNLVLTHYCEVLI